MRTVGNTRNSWQLRKKYTKNGCRKNTRKCDIKTIIEEENRLRQLDQYNFTDDDSLGLPKQLYRLEKIGSDIKLKIDFMKFKNSV